MRLLQGRRLMLSMGLRGIKVGIAQLPKIRLLLPHTDSACHVSIPESSMAEVSPEIRLLIRQCMSRIDPGIIHGGGDARERLLQ